MSFHLKIKKHQTAFFCLPTLFSKIQKSTLFEREDSDSRSLMDENTMYIIKCIRFSFSLGKVAFFFFFVDQILTALFVSAVERMAGYF